MEGESKGKLPVGILLKNAQLLQSLEGSANDGARGLSTVVGHDASATLATIADLQGADAVRAANVEVASDRG
jgi:hypothetical protein